MSIHGIQKIMGFLLDSNGNLVESPADYAIAFKMIIDQMKNEEKLKKFSRLVWPLIMIQSGVSSHIIIDDIGVYNLNMKISNAPRQSTVGHVLRNLDNRTHIEMLDRIKDILLYTEEGKKITSSENKDEEKEEFKDIEIKGLFPPQIIEGFAKLILNTRSIPISDYSLLESKYSVEIGLELTQKYKNILELTKGNKVRWQNLKSLLEDPFTQWTNDLKAQIKDTELRYKSAVSKEESNIRPEEVVDMINAEKDKLDQWNLQEKKNILEKIGGSLLAVEQLVEDIRMKNKYFLNTDSFKMNQFDKAIESANNYINYLLDSQVKLGERINIFKQSIVENLKEAQKIDNEAKERTSKREIELKTQLAQRNSRIQTVSQASESYINQLKDAQIMLQNRLDEIHNIIGQKMESCEKDLQDLVSWGLLDTISQITMPVLRIFLPIYAGLFENDEGDERLVFAMPSIIEKELSIKPVCDGFKKMEDKVTKMVDNDMKIRSNFEFSMEKLNLLDDELTLKAIKDGFRMLQAFNLADQAISEKYIVKYQDLTKK